MTVATLVIQPAVKVIGHLSSLVTYEDVPCVTEQREDSCPYLGHVPFFAPKLKERDED